MTVPFTCPHCGARTMVGREYLGRSGPCASCGKTIHVPPAEPAPAGPPRPRSAAQGVGVLVVVAVLGLFLLCGGIPLAVFFWGFTATRTTIRAEANAEAGRAYIAMLEAALEAYRMDTGSYPSTGQGLGALKALPDDLDEPGTWRGPYTDQAVPRDPWGNPYRYECPGKFNPDSFDLWSSGPDGRDRTADDVGNWIGFESAGQTGSYY